ncbi:MAG: rhodanese-like domain-containing protein [Bacteroidota bacterium]
MKNQKTRLTAFLIIFLTFFTAILQAQTGEPWTAKDLMAPDALASLLSNPKAAKPVIYNVGPLANIKGAINIGSMTNKTNLDKLGKSLAGIAKERMVVIYCGCCPFRNCPNIRPAFNLLKERGFTNSKLLNLKQNLKVDWTDFGYPMD